MRRSLLTRVVRVCRCLCEGARQDTESAETAPVFGEDAVAKALRLQSGVPDPLRQDRRARVHRRAGWVTSISFRCSGRAQRRRFPSIVSRRPSSSRARTQAATSSWLAATIAARLCGDPGARGAMARDELRPARDEPGYEPVPPRLMIEQMVTTADGARPDEVRLFVFDGKVAVINTVFVEDGKVRNGAFHSPDWTRLNWHFTRPVDRAFPRPNRLDEMIVLAERLGRGLDHVRVDMYDCGDRIWIGELTVYSWSGHARFTSGRGGLRARVVLAAAEAGLARGRGAARRGGGSCRIGSHREVALWGNGNASGAGVRSDILAVVYDVTGSCS